MNKLNKIATTISTTHNLNEMEQQVVAVKKSNLTEEEKNKALKSHNKMIKVTTLIVAILVIIMAISMVIGFSISIETGAVTALISLIVIPTILITYMIRKRKLFSDWENAYSKVNKGFDGLSEQEINRLKPNSKEEKIIKKYKKKSIICVIIFIIVIALEFIILLNLDFSASSPVAIILLFIIIGIWYLKMDCYSVEIHRIESGYYKKNFGFRCEKCKSEVRINFEDIEKYDSLPRNEHGIRVINCHNCGNPVPFYNFDNTLKDYKKYLEQTK